MISAHVADPGSEPSLGLFAAAGRRTAGRAADYAAVVELVREGYLLHYGTPRLVDPPDEDLALLAGDYLYALGLEQLAALGDLEAVRELSDLISLAAQIHADQEGGAGGAGAEADPRAGALWLATVTAIAAGAGEAHRSAKATLREKGQALPLYRAAASGAAEAGLGERLSSAAEAVGFSPSDLG